MKQFTISHNVSIVVSSDKPLSAVKDDVASAIGYASDVISHYLGNCGLEVNEIQIDADQMIAVDIDSEGTHAH